MNKTLSKLLVGDIVAKHTVAAPIDVVMEALEEAIEENHFHTLVIHDLKKTYVKNNLPLGEDFEYRIVHICNAQKSHRVLTEMSYDMGIMMPKAIIVAREEGQTVLRHLTMKPWEVGMMFPDIDIAPMAKSVAAIMEEITSETIRKARKRVAENA